MSTDPFVPGPISERELAEIVAFLGFDETRRQIAVTLHEDYLESFHAAAGPALQSLRESRQNLWSIDPASGRMRPPEPDRIGKVYDARRRALATIEMLDEELLGNLAAVAGTEHAVDVERVLCVAAEHNTMVELNASPWRLDLAPEWHARAQELGIGVPIDPDAHDTPGMDDNDWGIGAARHGGLTADDVPNTLDVDAFLARCRG